MRRIVSLIASATEIVCALGREAELVGRSHECDYPVSVKRLPFCTAPRFDISGSSRQIDDRVKGILQEGPSVYRVDALQLQQLRPDVIITQAHCEVCAVSLRDVEQALGNWLDGRPVVVSLSPNALADVWSDIERVANALANAERGVELVRTLQGRMADISRRAWTSPRRPSVACIEWIDPLMAAGNWMPELVERAGGVDVFGRSGKHSPCLSWDELRAKDPDILVVMPCGWDMARTQEDMPVLTSRPEWSHLKAVKNRRVCVTDGNQYFNRPGPRLVESLEILAEIVQPESFDFGHRGSGWQLI